MKVSDYIVEYVIEKGITDVFGYPGGMVTHLMDSFRKYNNYIHAHLTYHEQGAAMAACGYAQISGKTGIAYATSGPGATNMITGICNAYMDSIPVVFITGQVNSYEQKGDLGVRQRGFQETDIVNMVSGITKYAVQINSPERIRWYLDYAFYIANIGRKGPVLLDIAMDVMRATANPEQLEGYIPEKNIKSKFCIEKNSTLDNMMREAIRPVILLGNGLQCDARTMWTYAKKINEIGVPVVSSMLAIEKKANLNNFYGFIGAYGDRTANFIVAKSDLVIAIGARLDIRQVGAKRINFAPNAKIVRIDVDCKELEYKVRDDEYSICVDASEALNAILEVWSSKETNYAKWIKICNVIQANLLGIDNRYSNQLVREISKIIPEDTVITTDVGQNQVWVAQSFIVKQKQRILFSGGHGAMGYSLPASIGASLASEKNVYSFNGDGGIQMNIQELQVIARENLPIKVIIFNNNALGMIRHFQEMYFSNNYFQTTSSDGFTTPNFEILAKAYGLEYRRVENISDVQKLVRIMENKEPALIEIQILENTYVYPKLEYGKPNQDQEPLLDRDLYEELMNLTEDDYDVTLSDIVQ